MDEGAQEDEQVEIEIDNRKTVGSENSSASEDSEEDDDCWKCGSDPNRAEWGYQVLWSKGNKQRTKYAKCAIDKAFKSRVWERRNLT